MTFGFSRDDIGKFLGAYQDKKILDKDPFATIDTVGVGAAGRDGRREGPRARGRPQVGICGEHGGDPASIQFFHKVGLDYVSCSPLPRADRAAGGGAGGAAREGRGLGAR